MQIEIDYEKKIPIIEADLQKRSNEMVAKNNWDFKLRPVGSRER